MSLLHLNRLRADLENSTGQLEIYALVINQLPVSTELPISDSALYSVGYLNEYLMTTLGDASAQVLVGILGGELIRIGNKLKNLANGCDL